jgi:hypothetical protein
MPLDPSIPLSGRPVEVQNPLQTLSTIAQLQGIREAAELRREAAEEARRKRRREEAYEQALQESMTLDPQTGQPKVDYTKLLGNVPAPVILDIEKALGEHTERMTRVQTSNLTLEQKKAEYFGGLARTVAAAQYNPVAFGVAITTARKAGAMTAAQADEILAAVEQDPTQIKAFTDAAIAQVTEPKGVEKIATVDAQGRPVTQFVQPTAGASYPAAPKDVNLQAKDVLLDGRPALANFNPDTGTYHVGGQDVTARVRPMPEPNPLQLVSVIGPDGKPVYVPEGQAVGKTPGSAAGAALRPVTSGDAGRIADLDTSRDDLAVLSSAITQAGATGTAAKVGASLPNWVTDVTGWGTSAKQKQALIDRVKQVIGKALEGGVLRKEDEYKYEKILPTIADPPPIVLSKLRGLDAALLARRQTQLDALSDANYDTSRFEARTVRPPLGTAPSKTTPGPKKDPMGIR